MKTERRSSSRLSNDVVIPRPYAELSSTSVLTMSLLTGTKVTGRDSVIAAG
jgi:predicted unusual protein kinase regulating ubiquinone biosynthesis (AarF/ABC1/UbiB family)